MTKRSVQMSNTATKEVTTRVAQAQGYIAIGEVAFKTIQEKLLPKGDPISISEIAGIIAAKKTSELIPLCHQINLDHIDVHCELLRDSYAIKVVCQVETTAKTGVEMEALTGVSIALLTLYDLIKPVTKALKISDVQLNYKSGGKSGLWCRSGFKPANSNMFPPKWANIMVATMTVSDRAYNGIYQDQSGPVLQKEIIALGAEVKSHEIVPDQSNEIQKVLEKVWKDVDLVILTGGTGIGPKDITPDVVEDYCDRLVPGIAEVIRAESLQFTKFASLSRVIAGVKEKTLFLALPGNPKAVQQCLGIVADIVPHTLAMLRGGGH